MSFDEQPTPLHPDYRRVTEHVDFKKLPPEMQALIKTEFMRYEDSMDYVRAVLAAVSERLR